MKKMVITAITALTIILSGCGDEDKAENKPEVKETTTEVKPEKKEEKPAKIEVSETAITMAVESTKQVDGVSDAAISIKDGQISFAVIVGASTNEETAQEIGANFIRQLSSFTEGSTPTKDYYGELYDQYDVLITVADSAKNVIAQGAKVKSSSKITW